MPEDFLRVSLAEPFLFPNGWAVWSVVGLLVAPVAIIVSSTVFSLLPQEMSSGRGTVDAVAGLVETVDPKIFINLLIVTGAPYLLNGPTSLTLSAPSHHSPWCSSRTMQQ